MIYDRIDLSTVTIRTSPSPTRPLAILGLPGSLRAASRSRGLLREAAALAPDEVTVEIADLRGLPLFDEDLEALGDPAAVADLKRRVALADALLIAVPEYNGSVPGVLKNAIDWLSRPPRDSVLRDKPTSIVGLSGASHGGVQAVAHTQAALAHPRAAVLDGPILLVPRAHHAFDASGDLLDPRVREALRDLLERLVAGVAQPLAVAA